MVAPFFSVRVQGCAGDLDRGHRLGNFPRACRVNHRQSGEKGWPMRVRLPGADHFQLLTKGLPQVIGRNPARGEPIRLNCRISAERPLAAGVAGEKTLSGQDIRDTE